MGRMTLSRSVFNFVGGEEKKKQNSSESKAFLTEHETSVFNRHFVAS